MDKQLINPNNTIKSFHCPVKHERNQCVTNIGFFNDNLYSYSYECEEDGVKQQYQGEYSEKMSFDKLSGITILSVIDQGRLGNNLFWLSLMILIYDACNLYYSNRDIKMITNWNCKISPDIQAGLVNKHNYPKNMSTDVFKYIDCKHIDYHPKYLIFCSGSMPTYFGYLSDTKNADSLYAEIYIYLNNNLRNVNLNDVKWDDYDNYVVEIAWKDAGIFARQFNYFSSDNIVFHENINESTKEQIKKVFNNEKIKIIISDRRMSKALSLRGAFLNKFMLKDKKEILKKYLFSNYNNSKFDVWVNKIKDRFNVTEDSILVCGHLRGGDFGIHVNKPFYVLYYDYYVNALIRVSKLNPGKKIIFLLCYHKEDKPIADFYKRKIEEVLIQKKFNRDIFGDYMRLDDINLEMHLEHEIYDILQITEMTDHIYFMSKFDNYIMSNSTYSFWSGYLSEGAIFYPNIYLGYKDNMIEYDKLSDTDNVKYKKIFSGLRLPMNYFILMAGEKSTIPNHDPDTDVKTISDMFNYKNEYEIQQIFISEKSKYFESDNFDNIDEIYTDISHKQEPIIKFRTSGGYYMRYLKYVRKNK